MGRTLRTQDRWLIALIVLLCTILLAVGGYAVWAASGMGGRGGAGSGPGSDRSVDAALLEIARLGADQRWAQAREAARRAVDEHPEHRELRIRYAELLQHAEDALGAYEQYVEALRIGPRDAGTEHLAGLAATRAGDRRAALDHFERAHAAAPEVPGHALHLGLTQFNLGQHDRARASLYLAAQGDPENATAWGMLAQIAMRSGNREMAREYIARARELDPAATVWRLVEADALAVSDPERAAELITRIDPTDLPRPYGLHVVRTVLGSRGMFSEAARYFAFASDAEPEDPDLAFQAAELFERAGLVAEARAYARRALQTGAPEAQRLLARLGDG